MRIEIEEHVPFTSGDPKLSLGSQVSPKLQFGAAPALRRVVFENKYPLWLLRLLFQAETRTETNQVPR